MILILVFQVIPLPFTKLSKLLLYNLVLTNQSFSRLELLVKQIVAKSKNGNAGIKGKIAPIAPNTTPIHPITMRTRS